jgi:hypothetical protein
MTSLKVEVITPEHRRGEQATLFIMRGLCKFGNHPIDMKPDSARREGDICFLEENDGAPGTEWRFKVLGNESALRMDPDGTVTLRKTGKLVARFAYASPEDRKVMFEALKEKYDAR